MDNIKRTKSYFKQNADLLKKQKQYIQAVLKKETASALNSRLNGRVLDIGSGTNIYYSLDNVSELVSMDIAHVASKCISPSPGILKFIQGDARNIPAEDSSFDCVVVLYCIHHLAGDSLSATFKNAEKCIRESFCVLKKTGKLFIAAFVISKEFQKLENIFFNFTNTALNLMKKPMVYLFSLSDIKTLLGRTGYKITDVQKLRTDQAKFSPLTFSISMPFKYLPLHHFFIEGEKK